MQCGRIITFRFWILGVRIRVGFFRMKFEGLGLIVNNFEFWGLCLWFRSMVGVSHFCC